MSNNIPNMNGANPVNYNPQGHKSQAQQDNVETKEAQTETSENKDPLKYVPTEQLGRAMVNKSHGLQRPQTDPKNIENDIFTFILVQDFARELLDGYIQKGVDPKKAQEMTMYTLDVLLNPVQTKA